MLKNTWKWGIEEILKTLKDDDKLKAHEPLSSNPRDCTEMVIGNKEFKTQIILEITKGRDDF